MILLLAIYPLYATYTSIKKPLKAELHHWMTFWFVYQSIMLTNMVVWWIPFVKTIESLLLISLFFPPLTDQIRKNLLFPYIKEINRFMSKIKVKKHIGCVVRYTQRTIAIGSNKISSIIDNIK